MIMNARRARVETNGIGIADEMHFVPAIGELHAQLGRDDATAAIRGIACDPDLHVGTVARCHSRARPGSQILGPFSNGSGPLAELSRRPLTSSALPAWNKCCADEIAPYAR